MGLFDGKTGLVFGIANDHSIAWAITKKLHEQGAEMGFTHLPDRDPERPRMEMRLRKLVEPLGAKIIQPCDVQKEEDLDRIFAEAKSTFGTIDFILHSIAYAPIEDLKCPTHECSREGFKMAMEISAFSLLSLVKRGKELMPNGGSVLSMTYYGGEKVVPGYNMMGVCKAALESCIAYAAHELGPKGIRVNGLSAGPLKTLAASAVGDFSSMMKLYESFSPLRRNISMDEVGQSGMFLLSDMAKGITGEIMHVDSGYHIMGAPPHELQEK